MCSTFNHQTVEAANSTKNKAYCEEYFSWWWCYDGTIKFNPSYKTPSNPGYYLKEGRYVKQAYVNFTRKENGEDVSVIGGRKYTKSATNKTIDATYSVTATAKDSINLFTNQTQFWYGWLYFSYK